MITFQSLMKRLSNHVRELSTNSHSGLKLAPKTPFSSRWITCILDDYFESFLLLEVIVVASRRKAFEVNVSVLFCSMFICWEWFFIPAG